MRLSVFTTIAVVVWMVVLLHPLGADAAYSQIYKDYDTSSEKFFDAFDFSTDRDLNNAKVDYVNRATALEKGFIKARGGSIYLGVDHKNVVSPDGRGRQSVRLESKDNFTRGLFLLDLKHMPYGCGTWPAFWTLGSGPWPHNGEIDIIEGVANQPGNLMALHTSPGCRNSALSHPANFTKSLNCDIAADGQYKNQGCSLRDRNPWSWGKPFNDLGGGHIAMEWTSDFIKIWMWPRDAEPKDMWGPHPEPMGWGEPAGLFHGECEIDRFFKEHRIIFNITFCGDWAGNTWDNPDGCAAATKQKSCDAYVMNNPDAFKDAYWDINKLRVWQS